MSETTSKRQEMRRDFADRADLIAYLKSEFLDASAANAYTTHTSGGRAAAEVALDAIELDLKRFSRYWRVAQKDNFDWQITDNVLLPNMVTIGTDMVALGMAIDSGS